MTRLRVLSAICRVVALELLAWEAVRSFAALIINAMRTPESKTSIVRTMTKAIPRRRDERAKGIDSGRSNGFFMALDFLRF